MSQIQEALYKHNYRTQWNSEILLYMFNIHSETDKIIYKTAFKR